MTRIVLAARRRRQTKVWREDCNQFDVFANELAKKLSYIRDGLVQVDTLRSENRPGLLAEV